MNNIFTGLLVAAPLAFIILYFSLVGKEEVKNEQQLQDSTQRLHEQKFDDAFHDTWNGSPKPGSDEMKERAARLAGLKEDVKAKKEKRDSLDAEFDTIKNDMNTVLKEENQRLGDELSQQRKAAASAVQAGADK